MKSSRFFAIFLILTLILPLASCKEEASPPPVDKKGFQYIGLIVPQKGILAPVGQSMIQGAEMAVNEANEQNPERPFRLLIEEEGANLPERARLAFDPRVSVFVGHVTEKSLEEARLWYGKSRKPVILPVIAAQRAEDLARGLIFRLPPGPETQAAALGGFAAGELDAKNVLIVYGDKDDAARAFDKGYKDAGGKGLVEAAALPEGVDALTGLAEKAAAAGTDAVFLDLDGMDALYVASALKQAEVKAAVLGRHNLALPDSAAILGGMFEDVFLALPFHTAEGADQDQDFTTRYEGLNKRPPSWPAALTYDATRLAVNTLDQVGDDPAAIRGYLAGLGSFEGLAGTYGFGNGPESPVSVVRVDPYLMSRLPCLGEDCGPVSGEEGP